MGFSEVPVLLDSQTAKPRHQARIMENKVIKVYII